MGLLNKKIYDINTTYKAFELKKNEVTMAAYLEYKKLKTLVENMDKKDVKVENMGVKANKCAYYKKAETVYRSCYKDDYPNVCKLLIGQNCKDYFLNSEYDKLLLKYEKEKAEYAKTEEIRKILWDYKLENNLSNLSLQLDIGISSGTIWNFLHNIKIKEENYQLIKKFTNKIRR